MLPPVVLDVGTNTESIRDDPLYEMPVAREGAAYDQLVDEFVEAARALR